MSASPTLDAATFAASVLTDPYEIPVLSRRYLRLVAQIERRVRKISVSQWAAQPSERRPVLIDVREFTEWRAGHAAGAVHISRGIIDQRIEAAVPDLNTPLVCYCADGNRSVLAAESLQRLGYRKVYVLSGGLAAWERAGQPVIGRSAWD